VEFQVMDESRIATLKESFKKYIFYTETFQSGLEQNKLMLVKVFDNIDPNSDIQTFIEEKKTNLSPPPLAEYEPYTATGVSAPTPTFTASDVVNISAPTNFMKATNLSKTSTNLKVTQNTNDKKRNSADNNMATAILNMSTPGHSTSKRLTVKAIYDYQAEEGTEISFAPGDIVVVTSIDDSGWWHGELKGKSGMFPRNYVEIHEGSEDEFKKNAHAATAPAATPAATSTRRCKVLYEFEASSTDELTIRVDEIITIDSEAEGWFIGKNEKGQSGMFPANYVQILNK